MAAETGQVEVPVRKGQEKIGFVVSTRMAKTIVVEVTRRVQHPLYRRVISKRKKFYAHDEDGQATMGDMVRIIEHAPISKLKRWALKDVIRKAAIVGTELIDTGQTAEVAPVEKVGRSGERKRSVKVRR